MAGAGEKPPEFELQRKVSEPAQPACNNTTQSQGTDSFKKSSKKKGSHLCDDQRRASSYDPGFGAGSATRINLFVYSYWKFQPGYQDEK